MDVSIEPTDSPTQYAITFTLTTGNIAWSCASNFDTVERIAKSMKKDYKLLYNGFPKKNWYKKNDSVTELRGVENVRYMYNSMYIFYKIYGLL